MKALIAGATGLVGRHLTEQLIRSSYYEEVVVLVRKKHSFNDPKIREIVFDYDKDATLPQGVDDVFICLGTTIRKAGSKSAFEKVDYKYVTKIAALAESIHVKSLQVVSSSGAKFGSRNFYLGVKGKMEKNLSRCKIPSIHILRPSLILGQREDFRFGEKVGKLIIAPFMFLMKGRLLRYKPVKASMIANAMFKLAKEPNRGVQVVENEHIYELNSKES